MGPVSSPPLPLPPFQPPPVLPPPVLQPLALPAITSPPTASPPTSSPPTPPPAPAPTPPPTIPPAPLECLELEAMSNLRCEPNLKRYWCGAAPLSECASTYVASACERTDEKVSFCYVNANGKCRGRNVKCPLPFTNGPSRRRLEFGHGTRRLYSATAILNRSNESSNISSPALPGQIYDATAISGKVVVPKQQWSRGSTLFSVSAELVYYDAFMCMLAMLVVLASLSFCTVGCSYWAQRMQQKNPSL